MELYGWMNLNSEFINGEANSIDYAKNFESTQSQFEFVALFVILLYAKNVYHWMHKINDF